jgi:spore coat polysaccharide biosynthesis protein SpsF
MVYLQFLKIMTDNSGNRKPLVIAVVQARMGSTRLQGKALADLAGRPLLYHVLERTAAIEGVDTAILATGAGSENDPLERLALDMGLQVFRGSERDVLERYYQASLKYPSDYIVRVTGDNPFTDVRFAGLTVRMAIETGADLCSFSNLPLGTAVEIISQKALHRCRREATEPWHFEHVTPYIKENPGIFSIVHRAAEYDNPLPLARLTVDTREDLELAGKICGALYRGRPFGIGEILDYLEKNPGLLEINSSIEQKSMTSWESKK